MKTKEDKQGKRKDNTNPYLNGREEWNERYGGFIKAKKMWQGIGLVSLALAVVSVFGVITFASKSSFVPYVVEIDKLGNIRNVSNPNGNFTPETKHIQSVIANWIEHTRSVWTDGQASKMSVEKSFSHINKADPAFIYLSEFSKTNWQRGATETVTVEIIGEPLKITDKTWQVEWKEYVKSRNGNKIREEIWKGNFEVYFATPKTQALTLNNPLGVQIKTIQWSKQKIINYTKTPEDNDK